MASLDHRLQAGIPTGCEGRAHVGRGGVNGVAREVRGEMGVLGEGFTRGREWEALGGGGACGWRGMWDGG